MTAASEARTAQDVQTSLCVCAASASSSSLFSARPCPASYLTTSRLTASVPIITANVSPVTCGVSPLLNRENAVCTTSMTTSSRNTKMPAAASVSNLR